MVYEAGSKISLYILLDKKQIFFYLSWTYCINLYWSMCILGVSACNKCVTHTMDNARKSRYDGWMMIWMDHGSKSPFSISPFPKCIMITCLLVPVSAKRTQIFILCYMNEYLNPWYILAETRTTRHVIMMHFGNDDKCTNSPVTLLTGLFLVVTKDCAQHQICSRSDL